MTCVAFSSRREQIQGVSIDWFSAMSTSREIQLFSECLKRASQRWRIHRNINNNTNNYNNNNNKTNAFPPLKISLSYYPMQTHPNDVFPWVDRIQVMTYGLSRPPPSSSSSRPYQQKSDQMLLLAQQTTEQAVQALIHEAHCPPGKIWLGVPLYAQAMTTATTTNLKNKPPILTISEAMVSYSARGVDVDDGNDNDDDMTHHIQQYLHEVLEGYQWESLEIMTMKRDLVYRYSLGGLFVWELGQDATNLVVPGNGGGGVFPGGVSLTMLSHLCSAPTTATTAAPLQTIKLGQHPNDNHDDHDDTRQSVKDEL